MEMIDAQKTYNMSRESASRFLKVSIRTLDRYIRSKKVSTRIVDGRIWLSKEELESFKVGKSGIIRVDSGYVSTDEVSIDERVDNMDNVEVFSQDNVQTMSGKRARTRPEDQGEAYKNLYDELKKELEEKQGRLEIANYRVGQLEAQVKSSIPMLEYHRERYEIKKAEDELKAKLSESENLIKRISLSIKYEKFSKRIFLIILLVILALQPLWLILYFNPSG
jgi:hypothetical protein